MNLNDEPVYVGRDFGGRKVELTADLIASYCKAVGEDRPLYSETVPGLLLHSECYQDLNWYLKNIYGNLHARQEWELFRAIPVGSQVSTKGFIRERYRKRGRDYVVKETWTLDGDGSLVTRGITHQSFLIDDAARAESATVVDKDRSRDPKRKFEVGGGDGALFESSPKHVTEEMCMAFSGPSENYHTNRAAARALGFPDIVVQGMLPVCFLSELLTGEYGEGWLAGGKIDVKLVNVLWGGERVTAKARVQAETPEANRTRVKLDAWVEKDDGTKVVVGAASALR